MKTAFRFQHFLEKTNAAVKYILSHRKRDWDLEDYPLRFTSTKPTDLSFSLPKELQPVPWSASIVRWWAMTGTGETREAALEDLRQNFEAYKREIPLPRPGTFVPFSMPSTEKIDQYEHIAVDFFEKVLKMDYYACFISDQSSLWDFMLVADREELTRRVALYYKLELDPDEYPFLVDIFERIERSRASG